MANLFFGESIEAFLLGWILLIEHNIPPSSVGAVLHLPPKWKINREQ